MKRSILLFLSALVLVFSLVSCGSVEDIQGQKATASNLEFNFFETELFEKTELYDFDAAAQAVVFTKDEKVGEQFVTCYVGYCETESVARELKVYLEEKLSKYDAAYRVEMTGTTVYLGSDESFDQETLTLWTPEQAKLLKAFIKAEKDGEKILIGYCKTESNAKNLFSRFEEKLSEYGDGYDLEQSEKMVCVGTSSAVEQAARKLWTSQLYHTFIEDENYMYVVKGLGNTLLITFGALLIGVVFGFLFAVLKYYAEGNSKLWVINFIYDLYTTVIRGIPVTVLLLIFFFVILVSANGVVVAIIAFGINSSAYMAELVRGGINAVDKGQMEAARSLGMSKWQAMWNIIFPQAIKNILPAIGNECIALLKETSVAGYVAVVDLTRGVNLIRNNTYDAFNPLILSALIYLTLVIVMTKLLSILERRLRKSDGK